jgi:hypothetical protein
MSSGELIGGRPERLPRSRERYPWRVFWVLLAAAIVGYLAALPYLFQLFSKLVEAGELPMTLPVFVLVQVLRALILFGFVVGVGLLLARKAGLPLPLLEGWLYGGHRPVGGGTGTVRVAALAGVATGALTVLIFFVFFFRYLPGWPSEVGVPIWKRFLACFYGAIDEELLLRLFLLSLVLWLAQKMTRADLRSNRATFWVANTVVALIFAGAHLPAAAALMPLTPALIAAVLILTGAAGVVFGYMAWARGFEAAMIAHFASDLVIHLIGPLFGPR